MNRSQKSPKSGLSIAFKLSFVAASTLTYNCTCQRSQVKYVCDLIPSLLGSSDTSFFQQRIKLAMQTWVTGFSILIFSGNCAFVTRKVEIRRRCNSSTSVLISGYIMGSPTRDKAQCLGERPSINRSSETPA
jgi:hypothetical protein